MLEGKVNLLVNKNFGVMKVKGRSLSKRGTHGLYE